MVPTHGRSPHSRTLRRTLRRPRPAKPSTVWPCAQDNRCEGTGILANWLLNAVVKVVTTYTQPGHRVLLLEPAPYLAPFAIAGRRQAQPSPYAGLHEAGWTVVRLGRGVQTRTVVAGDEPSAKSSAESEFGLRPGTESLASDSAPLDRYELVLAVAEPHSLDWFCPADWADLLTPAGVLVVVTRGARSGGRFADPAGRLVRAAHDAGLHYLDRITLLRVSVDDVLRPGAASLETHGTSLRHSQVHDDLLVFGQPVGTVSAAESAGDRR